MSLRVPKAFVTALVISLFFLVFWNCFFSFRGSAEHWVSLWPTSIASKTTLSESAREIDDEEFFFGSSGPLSLLRTSCTSIANCDYGFVCSNGTCQGCSYSSECDNIQLICDTSVNRCRHKSLSEFTWRDGLTFGVVFVIAGLSSTGGVGGGFLFVPVLVLLTGFQARRAAALSQALVTGGSGANAFYGLITRHPFRERPRIDYYVVTIFMATILCGTSVGVILNLLFPNFFTLFMLAALVAYVFYVSLKKAIRLWREERASWRAEREHCQTTTESSCIVEDTAEHTANGPVEFSEPEHSVEGSSSIQTLSHYESSSHDDQGSSSSKSEHPATNSQTSNPVLLFIRSVLTQCAGFFEPVLLMQEAGQIIKYESRQYPFDSLLYVFLIFALLVVLSVLRGGGSSRTSVVGVENCSAIFILLYVIQDLGLLCFSVAAGVRNLRMHSLKLRVGYEFYERDMEWTRNRILWIAPLMIFLGAVGAWVGAGGSFMSTPILIAGVGMDPLVVQATAGFMNFVAALSSAIQYYVNHELPLDYGLALGGTAALGSFAFVVFINKLVYKFKLQAILVFIMSGVMLGAVVLNIYAGALELKQSIERGQAFPFGSVCG